MTANLPLPSIDDDPRRPSPRSRTNQVRMVPGLGCPGNYRDVFPIDRVGAKLPAQHAFGQMRPGEDDETACELVEPMHFPHQRQLSRRLPQPLGDGLADPIFECRRQAAADGLPSQFVGMANRVDARRLLHNDHVLVEVADDQVFGKRFREAFCSTQHCDDITGLQASGRVEAQLVIDFHASPRDDLPDFPPRLPRHHMPEHGGERRADLFRRNRKWVHRA